MKCPCCNQSIPDAPFNWHLPTNTVTRGGAAIRLTAQQSRIFDMVLRARPLRLSMEAIFERLHHDRDDGGPELNTVRVVLTHMRQRLSRLGIHIGCAGHYGVGITVNEIVENWRALVGYEGLYEVSDFGRVRSKKAVMRAGPHPGGYLVVHLYKDRQRKCRTVHSCVAEAFIGPRPQGQEVCHEDNDKKNNRLWNLRYDTPTGNNRDKVRHGTHTQGEAHAASKLTEQAVLEIRRLRGVYQKQLAERFGVTLSNISAIQRRKSWQHV